MRSRVVRVTLTLLAFAAAGASAYFYWTTQKRINATLDGAAAFTHARQEASRAVFDMRSAQQAYVAAGQNEGFWFQKVSTSIESLQSALADLERTTTSGHARAALNEIAATLRDFEDGDRRVRGYVSSGQRLLASDIIFSDGFDRTSRMLAALDRAAEGSRLELIAARTAAAREQMLAAGAAVGVALLVILLLVPVSAQPGSASAPDAKSAAVASPVLDLRPVAAPAASEKAPTAAVSKAAPTPKAAPAQRTPAAPAPPPKPVLELGEVARVCTDLARLTDSTSMPGILARATSALRASGLVLWVVDAERKQLIPIAAHGYPSNVLARMGSLPVDDENATAAAFRTGLVQTVRGGERTNGAIAAPLVSPTGCLGVMSVEVADGGEKDPARLAAASILSAQLATIVGPAAQGDERNSAAL